MAKYRGEKTNTGTGQTTNQSSQSTVDRKKRPASGRAVRHNRPVSQKSASKKRVR
jgi:hypothetical protein